VRRWVDQRALVRRQILARVDMPVVGLLPPVVMPVDEQGEQEREHENPPFLKVYAARQATGALKTTSTTGLS